MENSTVLENDIKYMLHNFRHIKFEYFFYAPSCRRLRINLYEQKLNIQNPLFPADFSQLQG
jgi:hypothetical protein